MSQKGPFNWKQGFSLDFSLATGFSTGTASVTRRLSQMKAMYADREAAERAIAGGDPLVYEFYDLGAPANHGDIAFGTSITYPGKVGNEYYMTKGHFHTIRETAEVYYTLSGEGLMVTEDSEGDVLIQPLIPGQAVYVAMGYAHRSVNTGKSPLVTFFAFRGDAGHDYASIETKGFRKLIIEDAGGKPCIADNPKWG
jgi:glucose-6-phosphate isomerase